MKISSNREQKTTRRGGLSASIVSGNMHESNVRIQEKVNVNENKTTANSYLCYLLRTPAYSI